MPGSLDGIRVLDLTTIYSGPIAASILGDQGADVVKVESPDGDFMRRPGATERNGVGGAFAMMNRNKRSVVIDLTSNEGRAVFERLVEGADVVVENYRPGVMERLKIGYERLRDINPRLIFASINGVGHTGPYAGRRVYDAIIQSISGIGSLQADPASERPILINSLICDKITSMTAAQAITSALLARERTGIGQRVDIAMLDAALFFLWPDNMLNYTFVGDEKPHRGGKSHVGMVRETRDGHICTMPVQAREWEGLFAALELPNLFQDERFRSQAALDSGLFQRTLNEAYASFDTDDLAVRLEEHEVPFARINPRDVVIDDPQVKAMGALIEFEHPIAGPMRQARPPPRFGETPAGIFRASPELGEHTREILGEAGYSDDEITDFRSRQIVR
ncbi:MAG: CoA transferase [Gammaproteobacteria bacterium]|nr:CoA transferase [Gammaproteobacteria bacterium]